VKHCAKVRGAISPLVRTYAPRSTKTSPRKPRIVPSLRQAISTSHDADAELDAPVGRQWGIAVGRGRLRLRRAAQRIDDAGELGKETVAGRLDDAA
jgi:hypothetical protein